ncbi:MAG: heparinase II/III-family protein, partial [Pirellulaceae bacterium]|nr:heparinase II/III-family protein [Pirellulaceae bacterium]
MMAQRMFTLVLLWPLTCLSATDQPVATFALRDPLNRTWEHELVFYPVADHVFGRDDLILLGPEDKPVVHQWVPAEIAASGKKSVAFFANVPAFGSSAYRLVPGTPVRDTDLRVAESPNAVSLENRLTGIRLGGAAAATDGPVSGIRLALGRWIGGGQLATPEKPLRIAVETLARGPVFAEALVSYEFPNFCYWRIRVRVPAGEPVVLVDEEFLLPEDAHYQLLLAKGWNPDEQFYRDNANRCQLAKIASVPGEIAFQLKAWPTWWGPIPEAHWASWCESFGDDLLAIGCRDPGVWVEPGRTAWDTTVTIAKAPLAARFQLQGFRRHWLLAAFKKSASLAGPEPLVAPPPQQALIRHGDVRLDEVKDFVLDWNDGGARHPGLFLTPQELDRVKRSVKVDPERLAELRTKPVFPYQMDDHVTYFLATGDVELGRNLAKTGVELLQQAIDGFVRQDQLRNQGSCPHHRTTTIMWSAILGDLALSPGVLTPPEQARLKAQLAFLGYTLASPTFHSPERGYQANPNMTTTARGMLGLVACCIAKHPRARQWAQIAIGEMQRELDTWCDANGGWLEAPHYMTVSMDSMVSVALALRGTGFSETEWAYHPKLKNTMAWLAKISTPPDPRLNGDRHMPEIGNTYLGERTCLPGWAAWIWRDRDPAYARSMQWMWQAQGKPRTLGIGGAYPGLQGYASVVLDERIPAAPPAWNSELFPDAGAVLRAHFPGDRETYLHYIQGRMHQHYDYDEGSFILWGKGQPLCEDFGYYSRAPAADHSRVDDGFVEQLGNEGQILEFASGAADYLRGQRAGWQRQILFVKDDDPLGPNYFVIRDSVLSGREADWRLWIATDETLDGNANPVRAKGRFAADLVVFFAEGPDGKPASQPITRRSGASGFATQETTQRNLQLRMPPDQPVTAVLYPVLKDQPTPQFTILPGGRVIRIASSFGTDYVWLGLEAFRFIGEGL